MFAGVFPGTVKWMEGGGISGTSFPKTEGMVGREGSGPCLGGVKENRIRRETPEEMGEEKDLGNIVK